MASFALKKAKKQAFFISKIKCGMRWLTFDQVLSYSKEKFMTS